MLNIDAAKDFALGVFILILALLMWRATGNFWAWMVFWVPGVFYVTMGWIRLFKRH